MEKLGRYEILEELGRGGCGVVYRAVDPSIGRAVAIKTIRSETDNDELRERFRREARSAGILSHPNIVTIHEFNDSGEIMYIAMEYIDGQTLAQHMRRGALPLDFTMNVLRSAADALDFAHEHHIVHRDVKPANFLINKHGHVKIADFGIAKLLDGDGGLTSTGMVVGTARYMSPEQIGALDVTGRSDQFSLGVIAYEMLAGKSPFQGNSWASIMHSIMATEPPSLKQFREEFEEATTDVLRKALAKDPMDRYGTCKEFVGELERSILGNTAKRKAYWESSQDAIHEKQDAETVIITRTTSGSAATTPTRVTANVPAVTATIATSSSSVLPPAATSPGAGADERPASGKRWIMPAAAGVLVVCGVGAWIGLRGSGTDGAGAAPTEVASTLPAPLPTTAEPENAVSNGASNAVGNNRPAPDTRTTAASGDVPSSSRNAPRAAPPAGAVSSAPAPATQGAPRAQTAPVAAPLPTRAPVAAPSPTPAPSAPVVAPAVSPAPQVQSAPVQATPPVRQEPPPAPVAAPPPPVVVAPPAPAPVPVARNVAPPAPAPAPARTPDPAETAAQARAAELQASRKLVEDAVSRYRQAFEARDLQALKAVWPGLSRDEQNSFQNFFRIARTVQLRLTQVSEPEITPGGATARYRRLVNASDERRALPAQEQTIKITFRKAGEQMLIDAIEAVNR